MSYAIMQAEVRWEDGALVVEPVVGAAWIDDLGRVCMSTGGDTPFYLIESTLIDRHGTTVVTINSASRWVRGPDSGRKRTAAPG